MAGKAFDLMRRCTVFTDVLRISAASSGVYSGSIASVRFVMVGLAIHRLREFDKLAGRLAGEESNEVNERAGSIRALERGGSTLLCRFARFSAPSPHWFLVADFRPS